MKRANKWLALVVGSALSVAIAAGATTLAFAQEPEATPTTPLTETGRGFGRGFGHHGGWGGDNFDALLADELGITVEQLEAAKQAAYSRALDQAVADGSLTQAQADAIRAKQALGAYIDQDAIVAEALGITVAELAAAQADGQRLPEIIAAQGLDVDTTRAAIQAGYEAAVQQAVTDGVITQEQADQFLNGSGGFWGGRGFRGFGGRGGPGGFFRGAPDTVTPDSDL